MNPKTIQTTKNGLVFFLYINIHIHIQIYAYVHTQHWPSVVRGGYRHQIWRRQTGRNSVSNAAETVISPGPELQRVSYMKNWMVKPEHLTPAQLSVNSCALFISSKMTPFLWRGMARWRNGSYAAQKPVLAGVCSQALLSCLFSCWAPELKFVWWITETHIWIVCANPARMLHFHNHMQLWGWLNSYTQIQFALRH